ncbi:hypothetical protein I203_102976 [Kwoniella mangroviensis CBS 8507]|uniref:uncharacterized protein n=1 Tax=Kwoniella mangroviensis CBS 8507 TaxID=1296122 RepID=UPI00080D5B44|nr:Atypical/ABC1/ABC1-A protein kinase [Kwoniella mangroviensis CBS 8507]OCF67266.1 Atypical/ABC1/ABC1-A protein kinase [Kwoniella mangroviensis CBS 8507]
MLSAVIRVAARSAAIQLEEVAALSAAASVNSQNTSKGKGKEKEVVLDPESSVDQVQNDLTKLQTLSDILEQHESRSTPLPPASSSTSSRKLSPLDRLIAQAPHSPPPPAPDTHPDRHIEAEQRKKKGLPPTPSSETLISPSPSKSRSKTVSSSTSSSSRRPPTNSIGSSLNDLIKASPRQNPPPAPDTHPDRHIEAEQSRKRKLQTPSPSDSASASVQSTATKEEKLNQSNTASTSKPLDELVNASAYSIPAPSEGTSSNVEAPATASASTQKFGNDLSVPAKRLTEAAQPTQLDTSSAISDEASVVQPIETEDRKDDLGADLTSLRSQLDDEADTPVVLRASKVPSSRLGRLFHYGSLAASLSIGAASESIRRTAGGNKTGGSVLMSDANIRRLVATLGRMRGAALKLGQFMSIQDNHMLPPEIEQVLHQVQAHANYMPDWQMEKVMREEFGSDWQTLFSSFDRTPIASASIGQVHRATLASTDEAVAVKIQFPGVSSSIESDLNNLSLLLRSSALLPKGLYLQNTIAVMRRELQDECDYVMEAAAGRKFAELLKDDDYFSVPSVVEEGTTGRVLTTSWMDGKPLSKVRGLSQEARDRIGTNILRLCLMELFQFRFMQTDPNWANFLYTNTNGKEGIQLIDFGASREYTKEFMDGWYRLLKSCLVGDRGMMKEESLKLGYLTGEENDVMVEAHLDSMALVASPFSYSGKYPFAKQTITDSVRALIPIMLKHRLTPPPQETYSLNRKLSGAFLMCAKLGANVDCQKLWEENVGNYKEG